jgi:methyl-accepting chemotaxis protein
MAQKGFEEDRMQRINCWEFKKCGREKDCPAYPHHGRNCFAVTGSWCGGALQGSYEAKIEKCRTTCAFYQGIMDGSIDFDAAS